jgi:hypothetical protein
MGVCEMQKRLWIADRSYRMAHDEYEATVNGPSHAPGAPQLPEVSSGVRSPEPRGIGWVYCRLVGLFGVREAQAAQLRRAPVTVQTAKPAAPPAPAKRDSARPPVAGTSTFTPAASTIDSVRRAVAAVDTSPFRKARVAEAKLRLDLASRNRNRYEIEIHKKFSLAAACLIFVLLGAPIAVRFPRGGVGLVIGVSLVVFALYYVGLIGGESLANEGIVPPFWAMWGTNVILTVVGIVLLARMGRDSTSGRGGDLRDLVDSVLARLVGKSRAEREGSAS